MPAGSGQPSVRETHVKKGAVWQAGVTLRLDKLVFWMPHGQHRTGRITHDALRHASQQKVLEAGSAMRALHDQVNGVFFSVVYDLVDGLAHASGALDFQPRLPFRARQCRESLLRLLA